jgi:hypothetical protein
MATNKKTQLSLALSACCGTYKLKTIKTCSGGSSWAVTAVIHTKAGTGIPRIYDRLGSGPLL